MTFELPGDSDLSLRQRKKLQAKRRIQTLALRLLDEFSYEDLTVSQIAEAAEVSPSTVYRYFQTKEGIFLWDEYDETVLDEFGKLIHAHHPLEAMRRAINEVMTSRFDLDRERALRQLELIDSVPQLKQSMVNELDGVRRLLISEIVEVGWDPIDAAVLAGSLVGALIGVMEIWVSGGGTESLPSLLDRASETLSGGLDATGPP